jgi:hypothetical protein
VANRLAKEGFGNARLLVVVKETESGACVLADRKIHESQTRSSKTTLHD